MTSRAEAAPRVVLDAEERELVALELRALLPALHGRKRERYEALAGALDDDAGPVPVELLPVLESILEIALQTGRARTLYRAEGERILTAVLRRTPRGRQLAANLDGVNEALRVVTGHPLEGVQVRMRTLGHYTITIQSPAANLTLAIRPDGVEVESVTVGDA